MIYVIFRKTSMWDKLIFWPVRKELGGRIRLVIVGSAPLGIHFIFHN